LSIFLLQDSDGLKHCSNISNPGLSVCRTVEDYHPGAVPMPKPLHVKLTVRILNIVDLNWTENTMTLFLQIMAKWNDSRISVRNQNDNHEAEWYLVDDETSKSLFFPKLRFFNTKSISRSLDYGAQKSSYYWIHVPHHMEYRETIQAISYCNFDFSNFPFDRHECKFALGSDILATYNMVLEKPNITFRFSEEFSNDGKIPIQIQNVPFHMYAESIEPYAIEDSGYLYSATGISFTFERSQLGLLIGSFYGPLAVFAFLASLSYNISYDLVPGRMGLVVTLFLITVNVYNSVDAPPNRGFSYIELWMVGMQLPIIVAIVEYIVILGLTRYLKYKDTSRIYATENFKRNLNWILYTDVITFTVSIIYYILFFILYWV